MTTLTEKTLFSIYGVSIENPKDWNCLLYTSDAADEL